jgi:hypothetical protein
MTAQFNEAGMFNLQVDFPLAGHSASGILKKNVTLFYHADCDNKFPLHPQFRFFTLCPCNSFFIPKDFIMVS